MQWNTEPKDTPAETRSKASFLGDAKVRHAEIFKAFLEKADLYTTPLAYTNALESASWAFAQTLAKQSYTNGKRAERARQKA